MLNIRVKKIQPIRFKVCLRNFGPNGPEINEKKKIHSCFSFEHVQIVFCGILEDYSSFWKTKRVVIKLLKFLNFINRSCLGYCILEVAGRLLEE